MRKRELTTVKNKVLCQLEDCLLDAMINHMEAMQSEDMEVKNKAIMTITKEVAEAIKTDSKEIAMICYINDNGTDVTEEDLEGVPVKINVFRDFLSDLIHIAMGSLQDDTKDESAGKSRMVSKRS